jgi:hypothetical protein
MPALLVNPFIARLHMPYPGEVFNHGDESKQDDEFRAIASL